MARVQGRGADRQLNARVVAGASPGRGRVVQARGKRGRGVLSPLPLLLPLVGLLAAGAPVPLAAQEAPPAGGLHGFLEAALHVGHVHRDVVLLPGARAGLVLASGLELWGGGRALTGPLDLDGSGGLFRLSFGYGGVGVGWSRRGGPTEPGISLLVGAGHAGVSSRFSGVLVDSENLLVAEPSAGVRMVLHPLLAFGLAAGYRWTSEIDRLPVLSRDGLRGWTLSFTARLRQRS